MIVVCAIYWKKGLIWHKRISFLVIAIGLGTLLTEYASSRVIMKYELDFLSIIATAIFLTLGAIAIINLTNLIFWIFAGIFRR